MNTANYFSRLTDALIAGETLPERPAELDAAAAVTRSAPKPRRKRWPLLLLIPAALLVIAGLVGGSIMTTINKAADLYSAGEYEQAKARYSSLSFIPFCEEMTDACDYGIAKNLLREESFEEALEIFDALGNYKDSAALSQQAMYGQAAQLAKDKSYEDAIAIYEQLGDYEDSSALLVDCRMEIAKDLYRSGSYEECDAIVSEYTEARDDAYAYSVLCDFRFNDATGCDFETRQRIFDRLTECSYRSKDITDALAHPFFYVLRFYDTMWVYNDEYYLVWNDEEFSCWEPWEPVPGLDISYINYDDGLYFTLTDEEGVERPWFTVIGFNETINLHPMNMYVKDSEGNLYVFSNPDRIS